MQRWSQHRPQMCYSTSFEAWPACPDLLLRLWPIVTVACTLFCAVTKVSIRLRQRRWRCRLGLRWQGRRWRGLLAMQQVKTRRERGGE